MKAITTPAIIDTIRSLKDKSLSFTMSTPELSSAEKAEFMELQGINVQVLINPLDDKAPPMVIDKDLKQKSQSVRMRNVLFILWKQANEGLDFDSYYRKEMELLIDQLKYRIEDVGQPDEEIQ